MTRDSKSRRDWSDTYSKGQSRAHLAVEREVFGANEGIFGFTTVAQADLLAERLALRPGMRLLDIGSGRGWPGLYLPRQAAVRSSSQTYPCLPSTTAWSAPINIACKATAPSCCQRHALPFRPRVFDAVVRADVLS